MNARERLVEFVQSMEEGFIMRKLASIAVMGLSLVAVSSFADYPPAPTPGTSCKTLYNPTSNLDKFCGCYEQSSRSQCTHLDAAGLLPIRVNCDESPNTLALATWASVAGNITRFCKNQVALLHEDHVQNDKAITAQNCIDDVGTIITRLSGLHNVCSGHWPEASI